MCLSRKALDKMVLVFRPTCRRHLRQAVRQVHVTVHDLPALVRVRRAVAASRHEAASLPEPKPSPSVKYADFSPVMSSQENLEGFKK